MYQDAHLHLGDFKEILSQKDFLEKGFDMGINRFFLNSTNLNDFKMIGELIPDKKIIPFFGVHPWYSDDFNKDLFFNLEDNFNGLFYGIGEIGLDKKRGADFEKQKEVFALQVEFAKEMKRPISIHVVKSGGALIDLLLGLDIRDTIFLLHSFNLSKDLAAKLLDLGAFLSFSPRNLISNFAKTKDILNYIPMDSLLLETDYTNECSDLDNYAIVLKEHYQVVADIKNIELDKFKKDVWSNGTFFTEQVITRRR